ncbi:MAG: pitrilysin family protein [Nautiliaceae bacterium]
MHIIYEKDNIGRTFVELIFKNTGSIYSKDSVAYTLMHMLMNRGTLKDKEKFYSKLEEKAINLSTHTSYSNTSISLTFLNEKSHQAMQYLKELLSSPNFTKEALLKSKEEIKAKKETLKNNHDYTASKNLFKIMFKNTPLEIPEIGEKIESVSLEDIKNHFQTLSKKSLIALIGGKKINISLPLPSNLPKKDLFFTPKQGEIIEKKDVKQSYIYFGSPFNVSKDKWYLAKVATFILGAGGFGSRIMEEVRVKRGYAYSAYAFNQFNKNFQILKGFLQTKLQNTQDAKNLIIELIEDFTQKGVSKEELESAKKFLIGSEPLREETTPQRLKRKFEEYYFGIEDKNSELDKIKNLSLDEINDFIKNHKEITNLSFSIITK